MSGIILLIKETCLICLRYNIYKLGDSVCILFNACTKPMQAAGKNCIVVSSSCREIYENNTRGLKSPGAISDQMILWKRNPFIIDKVAPVYFRRYAVVIIGTAIG